MRRKLVMLLLLGVFVFAFAGCTGSKTALSGPAKESSAHVSSEEKATDEISSKESSALPAEGAEAESEPLASAESPPPEYKSAPKSEAVMDFSGAATGERTRPSRKVKAPPPASGPAPTYHRPSSPGVKAGAADDNLQFAAFLEFLEENKSLGLYTDVSRRLIISVTDSRKLPLADARVAVYSGDKLLVERRTYADGRAMIFLSEQVFPANARLVIEAAGKKFETGLGQIKGHQLQVSLEVRRPEYQSVPLDIAFVLDTTGSMGDEIQQLKQTLEYIHFQITNLSPRPDVRFGMVLFRDRGDDYVTREVNFTGKVEDFAAALAKVEAGGGGDTPEDVQSALQQTIKALSWRDRGVKLAFLIGDAPPHLDYGQKYTYIDAMHDAAARGIKITTIGASGLDRQGELVWRQIAQYTMAPFVFLTYGEKGDSEGSPTTVSHHVGSNWVAENLDAIVVRMVKNELAHYMPGGAPPREDYFVADASPTVGAEDVLEELFHQAVRQLVDYCLQRIDPATPTVLLPLAGAEEMGKAASALQDRLSLHLVRSGRFQLLEREQLDKVLAAAKEQYATFFDETKVTALGKLLPAQLAVLGKLSEPREGRVELLVKLVRLETGEILSLSLMKIDQKLLPRG